LHFSLIEDSLSFLGSSRRGQQCDLGTAPPPPPPQETRFHPPGKPLPSQGIEDARFLGRLASFESEMGASSPLLPQERSPPDRGGFCIEADIFSSLELRTTSPGACFPPHFERSIRHAFPREGRSLFFFFVAEREELFALFLPPVRVPLFDRSVRLPSLFSDAAPASASPWCGCCDGGFFFFKNRDRIVLFPSLVLSRSPLPLSPLEGRRVRGPPSPIGHRPPFFPLLCLRGDGRCTIRPPFPGRLVASSPPTFPPKRFPLPPPPSEFSEPIAIPFRPSPSPSKAAPFFSRRRRGFLPPFFTVSRKL